MTDTIKPRVIAARRMLTLTTAATTAVVGFSAAAGSQDLGTWDSGGDRIVLAQASAEGEGAASGEHEGEAGAAASEAKAKGPRRRAKSRLPARGKAVVLATRSRLFSAT